MAWTTPLTAVASATLTAAQWNASVRDNLLQTAPALATAAGRTFVTTGTNAIAERVPGGLVSDTTARTTTSTSYTATLSGGTNPTYSCTTGTAAEVFWAATITNDTNAVPAYMSVAVSGATTVAANDDWALWTEFNTSSADSFRVSMFHRFTGLTPGTNVFTCQYRVDSGTGRYNRREIMVRPL
jgi:hypothetical protein